MTGDRTCRVCTNRIGNRTFSAREMMLGTRHVFEYFECGQCGCMQISRDPANLSDYYPPDYFRAPDASLTRRDGFLTRFVKRCRSRYCLGERNWIGRLAAHRFGVDAGFDWDWFRFTNTSLDSTILDVGCGAGELLLRLAKEGFRNLTGIDAFVAADLRYPGVAVVKTPVDDFAGTFDVVMAHHCFEHMADPMRAMASLAKLVRPGRFLLVRTPVAGCWAWREYGPDWVQLDAPRHLCIQTERSMARLARGAGLELVDVVYDSTEFQFLGSEQYRRNVPLTHPDSFWGVSAAPVEANELFALRTRATQLNLKRDGDAACFYLRKSFSTEPKATALLAPI